MRSLAAMVELCLGSSLFSLEIIKQPKQMTTFPIITKPKRPTEFELQADLYFYLLRNGFDVRGEVKSTFQGIKSRFDLVVFVGNNALCIIEVKNTPHAKVVHGGKRTKQRVKYEEYDIPVIYFTPEITKESVLAKVRQCLE